MKRFVSIFVSVLLAIGFVVSPASANVSPNILQYEGHGPADGEFSAWTKLLANGTQVKLYAKYPQVGQKIQFVVQDENGLYQERAWLRVESADLTENGSYGNLQNFVYLIRTFDLKPGKNRFRVLVDGENVTGTKTYLPKPSSDAGEEQPEGDSQAVPTQAPDPSDEVSPVPPGELPDLSVTSTASKTTALVGESVTYTATVLNQNGSPAAGIPVVFKWRASSSTQVYTQMAIVETNASGVATTSYAFSSTGTPQAFAVVEDSAGYNGDSAPAHNMTISEAQMSATIVGQRTVSTYEPLSWSISIVDTFGAPVEGASIEYSWYGDSLGSGVTAIDGTATFNGHFFSTPREWRVTISVSKAGFDDLVHFVRVTATVPTAVVSLAADSSTSNVGLSTGFSLVAQLNNQPLAGREIIIRLTDDRYRLEEILRLTTDAEGRASFELTWSRAREVTIYAEIEDAYPRFYGDRDGTALVVGPAL